MCIGPHVLNPRYGLCKADLAHSCQALLSCAWQERHHSTIWLTWVAQQIAILRRQDRNPGLNSSTPSFVHGLRIEKHLDDFVLIFINSGSETNYMVSSTLLNNQLEYHSSFVCIPRWLINSLQSHFKRTPCFSFQLLDNCIITTYHNNLQFFSLHTISHI